MRAKALKDSSTSAKSINDVLSNLYERIEAAERVRFVDVVVVTDGAGTANDITVAHSDWRIRGVYRAQVWDRTTNVSSVARIQWGFVPGGITASLYAGDISPSRTYDVTLELRG